MSGRWLEKRYMHTIYHLFSYCLSLTEGGEFPPQGRDLPGDREPGVVGRGEDPARQDGGQRWARRDQLPQRQCPGGQGATMADHAPPSTPNGLSLACLFAISLF